MEGRWIEIFSFLSTGSYPDGYVKSQKQNLRRYSSKFTLKEGELFFGPRKVIRTKEEAREIFKQFHTSPVGGHLGVVKTRAALSSRFYWLGMSIDIDHWVMECDKCQKVAKPLNVGQPRQCIKVKMDSQLKVGFIGAGNMAFGIAKGILPGDVLPERVTVSAPSSKNLERFQELGVEVTHSNKDVVCGSDVVFVAVKPLLVPLVLTEICQHVTDKHVIVSVAAGVTLATLEELLPENSSVIRLMPNLPCVVQEGALLFARGTHAKPEDCALLRSLLQHCGLVEEGPEAWIDIHTGLSGSGVAFVYLFAEALAEGAVKMGMPSALAQSIASQTVLGAGRLLRDSGKHPAQLRSEVCTPGGTTIHGLHALERGGVRASVMSAVESATERAREFGQQPAAGNVVFRTIKTDDF